MSQLLGVLPLHQSVALLTGERHVLTEDDVDQWASNPGQTEVKFSGSTGRNARLAGYCDKARINGGNLYLYGDVDPSLPGGQDARWGIRDSGVYDQLGASLIPRADPVRALSPSQRDALRRRCGGFLPAGSPGVLITSLRVTALSLAPGAQWLGA